MPPVYPAAYDTWSDVQDFTDLILALHMNEAHARIINIEEVLGLSPQGGYADVKARIAAIENATTLRFQVGIFLPEAWVDDTIELEVTHTVAP